MLVFLPPVLFYFCQDLNAIMHNNVSNYLKSRRKIIIAQLVFLGIINLPLAHADVDKLLTDFKSPPASAAPHVWWHWMNGDINVAQAKADLEWMAQIGIGGVQVFDAGLGAPAEKPMAFGSDEWRNAMRESAGKAQSLGLDYVITTSPGWSATGGPWVEPADAMKKLVWSSIVVTGGQLIEMTLPSPSAEAGPIQDIPVDAIGHASHPIPSFYRDSKVLAVPSSEAFSATPKYSVLDYPDMAASLQDGQYWPTQNITTDDKGDVILNLEFPEPVTAYGVTLGLPGTRGFGTPNPPVADWQVCQNLQHCQSLAVLEGTRSLTRTAAFEPVSSRYFRLHLRRSTKLGFIESLGYTDGANKLPFPAYANAYAISEIRLHTQAVVNAFEEKAGFAAAPRYYPLDTTNKVAAQVSSQQVIDITNSMTSEGVLHWLAPKGNWQIIRLGYGLTGHENGPAQLAATGLEVDKLDAKRIKAYMQSYLENFRDDKGRLYQGITGLLSDSIESGPQNWTDSLLKDFAATLNYDPLPYLPTLTGVVVNSAEQTDRFLWDFRHYLAEQFSQAHYGTIANVARHNGLTYYSEALEDHRPQLGNDLDIRAQASIPMAAFWYFGPKAEPKATYVADIKGAASVATQQGTHIVAVEAMTTFGQPWTVGPKELRTAADRAFVTGGNRLMLHSSVHQSDGVKGTPGKSMMPLLGHYFNRNNTWADFAKPWVTYLSRTQFLLQQGYPAASFAYFIGEEAPVTSLFGDESPEGIPRAYDYDFVSANGLSSLKVDKEGRLLTKSGTHYEFLYLGGDSQRMTIKTLLKLAELVRQGLVIAGERPTSSPSLNDDQDEFLRLVKNLWSSKQVITAKLPEQAIAKLKLAPQWQLRGDNNKVQIEQRVLPEGQLYYLVNTDQQALSVSLTIPQNTKQAWLLDAVDGRSTPMNIKASEQDVDVKLAANQSLFVLVSSEPQGDTLPANFALKKPLTDKTTTNLSGPWTISFDPRFAVIQPVTTEKLTAISDIENNEIKGFSGISTYSSTFNLAQICANAAILRITEVGNIAQVKINGSEAGYLWTPPYQLDIAAFLQVGENSIEISVANYWANQLISQANHNFSRAGFPQGVYQADASLRMAGLAGDVTLRCE
jgi:hypothetical protein